MVAGRTVRCVECAGVHARSIVPRAECGQRAEGPSMAVGQTVLCWVRRSPWAVTLGAGGPGMSVNCGRRYGVLREVGLMPRVCQSLSSLAHHKLVKHTSSRYIIIGVDVVSHCLSISRPHGYIDCRKNKS